jgi:CheY-like chemotaxis protein
VKTIKYGNKAKEILDLVKERKRERPDLILLDIVLSDISGIEILKEAKKEKGISDIPFFYFNQLY